MNIAIDNNGNFAAPPRRPVDAVRTCMVKFFDFRGRASRSEFWWFFAAVMTLALLEELLPESLATAGFLLTAVVVQPPLWAVTVFCLTKGKPEQNRFDRGGEPFGFSFNQRPA